MHGLPQPAGEPVTTSLPELERCIKEYGFVGCLLDPDPGEGDNKTAYLGDEYWYPLYEKLVELDVPAHIHATGNRYGRGTYSTHFIDEESLAILSLLNSRVFLDFPKLKIILGHLGEGLPFWLFRLDYMHRSMVISERYPGARPLAKKPSDYLRENVWVTTSGMQWAPAIRFCQEVLGFDRVLYAMDYPYQFVPEEVKVTDEMPMTDEQRRLFYETNVTRLFRL